MRALSIVCLVPVVAWGDSSLPPEGGDGTCELRSAPPEGRWNVPISDGRRPVDLVRLVEGKGAGPVRFVLPTGKGTSGPLHDGHDDRMVAIVGGDLVVAATFHRSASGSRLLALDLSTGALRWRAEVEQLNVPHSKYWNDVTLERRGATIVMRGWEAGGCYVQRFDLATGRRLSSSLRHRDAPAPRVITTPSGLRFIELRHGDGVAPARGWRLKVAYVGAFPDGRVFDTTHGRGPFEFGLGRGMVIPGFEEGLATMRVGGKRKLMIPPALGYGDRGAASTIPPNAEIHFTVELLEATPPSP